MTEGCTWLVPKVEEGEEYGGCVQRYKGQNCLLYVIKMPIDKSYLEKEAEERILFNKERSRRGPEDS